MQKYKKNLTHAQVSLKFRENLRVLLCCSFLVLRCSCLLYFGNFEYHVGKVEVRSLKFYYYYRCCLKSLLRFFNSNKTGGRIDKSLNNLQGILFFELLKIQIIFKIKIRKGNLYLACFFICWYLILIFIRSKSKWFSLLQFLIQTDSWFHKIPPISFIYMLLFLFQKYPI